MLALKDITVSHGEEPVLAGANLNLSAGERLLVCGAAGSAKSTLLNVAAGLIPRLVTPSHFAGEVTLSGEPLSTMSKDTLFAEIGLVMQSVEEQSWDLGVEDLIAFPMENRSMPKAEIRKRVDALLKQFQLDALRGRRVLTLSGGERRMVAIAAAMALSPRLLILDEPTTGLDPAARQRLTAALGDTLDSNSAVLVAEQDPAAFHGVARTVRFISEGQVSEARGFGTLVNEERLWREAGILPPRRTASRPKASAPGAEILGVRDVTTILCRAHGQPVLNGAGFMVRAGEVLGLIGRNGAGKTTLFQSILGLARISRGTITIEGIDATGWTVARRARRIAYLPQNMRRILFNMTLAEEVLFAITAGADPGEPDRNRAQACLEKYGLGGLSETNPFALSVRQQALLGLACADVAGAAVAILDEPLLGRDLNGRAMLDLFIRSMTDKGRAVLLISHDLELVEEVATRTLILADGRVAFDGDSSEAWQSAAFRALGWPAPSFTPDGLVA
ncbi:ATP-binding cassette domain-containing protein [Hoeflea sp. CAU 1731]